VVYTIDSLFSIHSAFVVANGVIVDIGNDADMLTYEASEKIDLKGKFIYPGFHDGHCHFYGFGSDLRKIWLTGTTSFEAVLDTLKLHANSEKDNWIFGRGWDQNDWESKNYPEKSALDSLFPQTPVFLLRIDGHAALVNQAALDLAGVNEQTKVNGGLIGISNGKLTGILIDSAVDLVYNIIPQPEQNDKIEALLNAQKHCFAVGITTVTDAGLENGGLKWEIINLIDSLQKTGQLQMRVNAMASLQEKDFYKSKGKIETASLTVQGFKLYADGSLGSRGACLLQPYTDSPGHYGFLIHSPTELEKIAAEVASMGFQLNTHCIGDSSHRVMLKIYEKQAGTKSDHRWRIEHAQVIDPADYSYYQKNKIIPSVQPVHATSDMYWAEDRLGPDRIKNAYAYKEFLDQNKIIVSGSDFPVENINPLHGFFAAVARKDHKFYPEKGFFPQHKLSREETIKSFTIWPAYAAFKEQEWGTLTIGKVADFVVLDQDLMQSPEMDLLKTTVLSTYIGGKQVYSLDQ